MSMCSFFPPQNNIGWKAMTRNPNGQNQFNEMQPVVIETGLIDRSIGRSVESVRRKLDAGNVNRKRQEHWNGEIDPVVKRPNRRT